MVGQPVKLELEFLLEFVSHSGPAKLQILLFCKLALRMFMKCIDILKLECYNQMTFWVCLEGVYWPKVFVTSNFVGPILFNHKFIMTS